MADWIDGFNKSILTGFIDQSILSAQDYQPGLLVNKKSPPTKVLTTLLQELDSCSEFYISVAFVTTSGVATLINQLKELELRDVRGKMLVSQYLNFTQPEALKRLRLLRNIDLRIATTGNSHNKGYIFKHNDHYNLIVGSSNLTAEALCTNNEWNLKVSALSNSGIVEKVLREFEAAFESGQHVTDQYISAYEEVYQSQFLLSQKNRKLIQEIERPKVNPNSMQMEALTNLKNIRTLGKTKALIISATGTGKTFLSAFDAKAFQPKKLLFVVHRLNIAKGAMKTFQSVFSDERTMGLYSGEMRELHCDFLFSTVQTISKSNHLSQFSKDQFDYIIIDETHRSGADSYQRLIQYFQPKFLLGMTATPDRTDGNDIFQLFDHNIGYEIRLSKAMEQDMLSTFHYYGVADLSIDNVEVDARSDFRYLIAQERVDRIIEKANFYGCDNGITRGLIFCSRKDEAIELSQFFNERGYKTVALTGENSEIDRAKAIELLESENLAYKLDYIFTVDIFNEGIDIPKINQIIMLRPTESAIIFIQQLGRGLRKIQEKKYLTVIDFIGNYDNNYLIPIALYGDTSYNKDTIRKLLTEGSRMIPGSSTINFDKITKERIFKSIDTANLQLSSDLKMDYNLLKFKLGRIPMMMDFIEHGSRDPFLYVSYSKSLYNFIVNAENSPLTSLTQKQAKLIEFFSKEINNAKRIEECLILKFIIEDGYISIQELKEFVLNSYNYTISDETLHSCTRNLNFEFIREKKDGKMLSVKAIYGFDIINIQENKFTPSDSFIDDLKNSEFKKYLLDSVQYSIYEFNRLFEFQKWQDGFVLYRKYSRKDVFRILNTAENPIAQNVGGYMVSQDNRHCPIFVNYHKEDHISESTKYEDEFINNKEFDWMSKSNRTLGSADVQSILGQNGPIRLPLFIKKNNDEGLEFYYMGEVSPQFDQLTQTKMPNDHGAYVPVVKIRFNLDPPVPSSLYQYLNERIQSTTSSKVNCSKVVTIPSTSNDNNKIQNLIPLYNFYAAAGTFSEMQSEKSYEMIEVPGNINSKEYFACRVVGESMNRIIPNGSICLFKIYSGGSRHGKILLIENMDIQDPEFNSAFTVKTYSSEKKITEESWEHETITLIPNSFDSAYEKMIRNNEDYNRMRVIGEFVKVIG
jgi:superfamily II DNA or RNA helicase/HKD family nuclease